MVSAADMTTGFYFGGTKAMDHNGTFSYPMFASHFY